MKKYGLVIFAAIAVMICASIFATGGVAYAADNSYNVISPELANYLYLDTPALTAIDSGKVAVYDAKLQKLFIAGSEQAEYPVTLRADESVIKLAFAGEKLYYLTNQSRLVNVTDGADVALGSLVFTDMAVYNDTLYFYNSLISTYKFDGTNFVEYYDGNRLVIGAKSFAVIGNSAYFLLNDAVYALDFATNAAARIFNAPDTTDIMSAGGKLYLLSATEITSCATDGTAESKAKISAAFSAADGILDISSDGASFAVLSGGDKAVYKYTSAFALADMYGCASDKSGWFNNPQKVVSIGDDSFAVWDKDNARVEIYKNHGSAGAAPYYVGYDKAYSFDAFAAAGNYALFEKDGKLYYTSTQNSTASANFTELTSNCKIGAIALFDSEVFLFDKNTNSIYSADISATLPEFKLFCYCPSPVTEITVRGNKACPAVYARSAEGVAVYTTIGRNENKIAAENVIAFDADYIGNIFTLTKADNTFNITKYAYNGTEYAAQTPIALTRTDFTLTDVCSFALNYRANGTNAYAVDCDKNILIGIDGLGFVNKSAYVETAVPTLADAVAENVTFVKSQGTPVYAFTDNYNLFTDVAGAGETLAVLSSDGDYFFVMTTGGNLGYVQKAATAAIPVAEISGTVTALHDAVNVYSAPTTTAPYTAFDKQQVFTLINDCAGFNNGNDWYKVSYTAGGNTLYGYLIKTRVVAYDKVETATEAVYAKAKAAGIGEKVNIYAVQDTQSAVLASATDGAKIKLLEQYNAENKFTLVEYDGVQGYALTAELQISNGLTGGQIAAIVLASVTLLITALYIIISRRNKKLSSK